jgi:CheY-like chemotaxis protein
VLVVDDNLDAAESLADLLRHVGHDVKVAQDGPGALEVAARFHPEVAVLDIGLPVMDGYELAAALKSREDAGPIRLVALTGYGQEKDRQRSREAGFDAHLVKPVEIDALLAALEPQPDDE